MVRRCSIRGTKGFQESYRSDNDALSCCYLFGVYKAEVECIERVPPRPSWLALKMLLFRRYCGPRGSSQGHKVNTHVINRNNTSSMKLKKWKTSSGKQTRHIDIKYSYIADLIYTMRYKFSTVQWMLWLRISWQRHWQRKILPFSWSHHEPNLSIHFFRLSRSTT